METTATATSKKGAQKDVYGIITEKIIEHLEKGIIPWREPWMMGGVPTSLISKRPFRGINVILLACCGYQRNLFLTSKQLKELGGSIQPDAKPHVITFWSKSETGKEKKDGRLSYYTVYNVSQCVAIPDELIPEVFMEPDTIKACERIVEGMMPGPAIRYKEPGAFYDLTDDHVNMPKLKSFDNPASYYAALFHQLAHSTGHFTRLDRMGLAQMSEFGCDCHTLEELVAEITTNYLENLAGIPCPYGPSEGYVEGWIQKFKSDRYLIFTACSLAQKAIDFILNIPAEEKEHTEE